MKCVYKLKCRDKEITEFYIGSSINFNKRKTNHKSYSNNLNGNQYCYPLYMFININGGFENWDFEVIKEYKFITKKELEMNEQYYIELLNPQLNQKNAHGYDIERKKKRKSNYMKIKVKCPHCDKELHRTSIKYHINNKHNIIIY